jgi:hypothetical protein
MEGVRLKTFLRNVYYGRRNSYLGDRRKYLPRSWVDAMNDNLAYLENDFRDFCWRLLLDFHSDYPQVKENAAVGLMEGTLDTIEECRKLLAKEEYMVVIDGLIHSTAHWDLIRDNLLPEHIQGTIIVSVTNNYLATYCKPKGRIQAKEVPYVDRITKV